MLSSTPDPLHSWQSKKRVVKSFQFLLASPQAAVLDIEPPEAAKSILLQSQLTQKSVSNLTRGRSESGFDASKSVMAFATRSVVAAISGGGWSESMMAVWSLRMTLLAHLLLRSSRAPVSRDEESPEATLAASPTTIKSFPA